MEHFECDVVVNAPPARVFAAFADWEAQSRWMVGTRVRATSQAGRGIGATVEAWSGAGRLGFLDTMTITEWDPPRRVAVLHTGRVVRGTGTMEVFELPGDRSRFVWSEQLDLPLGTAGVLGWRVVRPAFRFGVRRSLEDFARLVESGEIGGPAARAA